MPSRIAPILVGLTPGATFIIAHALFYLITEKDTGIPFKPLTTTSLLWAQLVIGSVLVFLALLYLSFKYWKGTRSTIGLLSEFLGYVISVALIGSMITFGVSTEQLKQTAIRDVRFRRGVHLLGVQSSNNQLTLLPSNASDSPGFSYLLQQQKLVVEETGMYVARNQATGVATVTSDHKQAVRVELRRSPLGCSIVAVSDNAHLIQHPDGQIKWTVVPTGVPVDEWEIVIKNSWPALRAMLLFDAALLAVTFIIVGVWLLRRA